MEKLRPNPYVSSLIPSAGSLLILLSALRRE